MKILSYFILILILNLPSYAQSEIEIELKSGTKLKGSLISTTAEKVIIKSELGAVSIKPSLLSEKTHDLIYGRLSNRQDLANEVQRLEDQVSTLKKENAELRASLASLEQKYKDAQRLPSEVSANSLKTTPKPKVASATHWITASSGIRHNSGCRWYSTSKGRACNASEGRACKVCGG